MFEEHGDMGEEAITKQKVLNILEAWREIDGALRILEPKDPAVYEYIEDMRLMIFSHANLCKKLWKWNPRRHQDEVQSLIYSALKDVQRLRFCKVEQNAASLAQLRLDCDALGPLVS